MVRLVNLSREKLAVSVEGGFGTGDPLEDWTSYTIKFLAHCVLSLRAWGQHLKSIVERQGVRRRIWVSKQAAVCSNSCLSLCFFCRKNASFARVQAIHNHCIALLMNVTTVSVNAKDFRELKIPGVLVFEIKRTFPADYALPFCLSYAHTMRVCSISL